MELTQTNLTGDSHIKNNPMSSSHYITTQTCPVLEILENLNLL